MTKMVAARFLAAPESQRSSTGTSFLRNSGRLPLEISANMTCSRSGAVMFETNRTNCDPVRSCNDLSGMPCVNSSTSGAAPLRGPEPALRGRKTSNGNTANGMRLTQRSGKWWPPFGKRLVIVLCVRACVQMLEFNVKLCSLLACSRVGRRCSHLLPAPSFHRLIRGQWTLRGNSRPQLERRL